MILRVALAFGAVAAIVVVGSIIFRQPHRSADAPPTTTAQARTPIVVRRRVAPPVFRERVTGALPAPLQDPSSAVSGARIVLAGGLTAADTSTDGVLAARSAGAATIGRLPSPRHDTAAAAIGSSVYVFGGGNGVAQLDDIVRIAATGATSVVAHLPAASSDSTAAAIGGTAYIVGGFTGTRWLDTIVAYKPGAAARVVGHLPFPVRYTAVTTAE